MTLSELLDSIDALLITNPSDNWDDKEVKIQFSAGGDHGLGLTTEGIESVELQHGSIVIRGTSAYP